MTRAVRRLLALLAVPAVACAGCAGSGREHTADTTAPTSTMAVPPSTPAAEPPSTGSAAAGSVAPVPTSSAPTSSAPAAAAADRWRPPPRTTWQYQLDGTLDLTVDAAVFDVDWANTTAAQVQQLHAAGRRVVCYLNAGAFEDWRPDAAAYPSAVLGDPLDGWPGERWLDVRRLDVLLPILAARMDACRAKGFDAVEPDNVDGYANATGFDLTARDQLRFNRAVAELAHDRGLAVGLKNDIEQVPDLEPFFDFAVNEECLRYDECDAYRPFLGAGKPVLHVEYRAPDARACEIIAGLGLTSVFKDVDLGPALRRC